MTISLPFPTPEAIKTRLYNVLAYRLGRSAEEISDHLHLVDELYMDSLDMLEVETGIAEAFNITVAEGDFQSLETVADLYHFVTQRVGPKNMAD